MAINLENLSPAELQTLIKNAEAQMDAARKTHIQSVRTQIDALLSRSGLAIDEVYPRRGGKASKASKQAVVPKYRNPENPTQTWSGRGKRPLWFNEALKKRGVSAENLLIQGATKAVPAKAVKKAKAKRAAARK